MEELVHNAKEELKRVDHLIYVSLKYTRTVDVLRNVIKRLINAFEFSTDALLENALEKGDIDNVPQAAKLKIEKLQELYKDDPAILDILTLYMLLRRLVKVEYDKECEYRRHVCMISKIDGQEVKITIDKVTEYYKQAKDFMDYVQQNYVRE